MSRAPPTLQTAWCQTSSRGQRPAAVLLVFSSHQQVRTTFQCNILGEEAGRGPRRLWKARSGAESRTPGFPAKGSSYMRTCEAGPRQSRQRSRGKAHPFLSKENRLSKYLICGFIPDGRWLEQLIWLYANFTALEEKRNRRSARKVEGSF